MKTKLKHFTALLLALLLALAMSLTMVGCDKGDEGGKTPDDSQQQGSGNTDGSDETKDSFTVTFHYGFDPADYDKESGTVKKYKSELKRETQGKKITLASAALKLFEVEGYEVTGYSTTDWQKDGISADMDVNVLYTPLETITVTFKNADGSVIKNVTGYQGRSIALSDYPDTQKPVYLVKADRVEQMDSEAKNSYSDYTSEDPTWTNYKVLTEDKARLNNSVVVPVGKYFKNWSGMQTAPTEDYTVTAVLADGEVTVSQVQSVTVDGVKDEAYQEVDSLVHSVIYSTVTGEKVKSYQGNDSGWAKVATPKNGTVPLDVKISVARDNDWLYFFFEVKDEHVFSLGKTFNEQIDNPWEQDGIEIYYGFDNAVCRVQVDALGYHMDGGDVTNESAYVQKVQYATSLIGADLASVKQGEGMIEARGATGYNIELAIPAYKEPAAGVTPDDTVGGTGWGDKVTLGDFMYFALQLNNIDALPSESVYQAALSTGERAIDHLLALESRNSLEAFNCVAFGSEFHDFVSIGNAKRYVLG